MSEERKESTREVSTAERTEKEGSNMSGDRASRRRAGRPGRRPAKVDVKVKLEKSRQSARECRARKKLRYQYLEDLVNSRENAIYSLREELEMYKQWCIQLDNGHIPLGLLNKLQQEDEKQAVGATGTASDMEDKSNSPSSQGSTVSAENEEEIQEPLPRYQSQTLRSSHLKSEREGKSVENHRSRFNLSFVNHQNLNNSNEIPGHEQTLKTSCAPISAETSFSRSNLGSDLTSNVVSNEVSVQNRRVGQVLNNPLSILGGNLLDTNSRIDLPTVTDNHGEKWRTIEFRTRKPTGSFEKDCIATEGSSESNDEIPMSKRKDSVDFKVGSDFRTMNIMSGNQETGINPNNSFTPLTDSSILGNNSIVQSFGNAEDMTRNQQTFVQSYQLQNHQTSFLTPVSSSVANIPFSNTRAVSQIGNIQGHLTPSLTNIGTTLTSVCSSSNFQVVPDEMHEFLEGLTQDIPSCTSNLATGNISQTFENVVPNCTVASLNSLEQSQNIVPSSSSLIPKSSLVHSSSNLHVASTDASSNEYTVPNVGAIPTIIDDLD